MKPTNRQSDYIIIPTGNKKRSAAYIKLLHSINSCTNNKQLETLRGTVLRYFETKGQDASELLAEYLVKEHNLSPYESEIETKFQRSYLRG